MKTKNAANKHILLTLGQEVLDFTIVVCAVSILGMLFLYHKAIVLWVQDMTENSDTQYVHIVQDTDLGMSSAMQDASFLDSASLDTLIDDVSPLAGIRPELKLSDYLSQKINHYDFAFNDLPPGKRLVANSIWVDTPIQDVEYASDEKLQNGDFDEELKKWIVKYPFTSTPWGEWNSLLFGHSTVSAREDAKNPFWYVFYKLPQMEQGDEFQVIRDGQLYTYQVQEKTIKDPKDVWYEIEKHDIAGQRNLTLMACYPLFSDLNRILVRAELIDNKQWPTSNIFSNS